MKRFFREYKFVWISYLVLFVLTNILLVLPLESAISVFLGWLFYMPFIFSGVYLYGLILGINIQSKTYNGWLGVLKDTALYMMFLAFMLLFSSIGNVINKTTFYHIPYLIQSIMISTLCFFLGQIATKWSQKPKNQEYRFVWIYYLVLLALTVVTAFNPLRSNLTELWTLLFLGGVYVYAFILGFKLQFKTNKRWTSIMGFSLFHFVFIVFLLLLPLLEEIAEKGVLNIVQYPIILSVFSSVSCVLGGSVARIVHKVKCNR